MRIKLTIATLTIATTCIVNSAEAGGGLTFQAVALSGQSAPGAPGRVFSFYYPPAISGSGRVAFAGWLTGVTSNDEGLWSGLPGAIQLVAREGSAAPGTTAVFSSGWSFPRVNTSGVVAFSAALGAGANSSNNTGIWSGLPGALSLVARAGNAAPGTPAGVVFSGGMQNWLMLNDAGQVVFRANLTGTGVTTANDAGIWAGAPGALQLVAREGDAAPGTGGVFDLFNYQFEAYPVPVINAAGEVVFSGHCTSGRGIWRWSGGVLELIALTNTTAPGTGALFEYLFDPWMNASGKVVFKASLMGDGVDFTNNAGVWVGEPGAVGLVVRKGSPAPGTSGQFLVMNFSNVGLLSIDDGGNITFPSSLMYSDGSGVPGGGGVWQYGTGGAGGSSGSSVVLYGEPAPGLSGVSFSSVNDFGPHPAGSIPFPAYLSGTGVNADNDYSYWLKDGESSPLMILREGDLFDVGGGVMRNIGQIDPSVQAPQGPGYTSSRQIVIGLHFWGGTSGIFSTSVPVPTSPGDMNCDGAVDGLDVDSFALAVLDPLGYAAELPGCNILNGNIDQSSMTDIDDIDLFVACVLNGGCL
jgi:hypothetical protein